MNRQAVSVTDVESSFGFETDGALGRHHLGSGLGNSAPSQQGVSHICRGATFGNSARNDSLVALHVNQIMAIKNWAVEKYESAMC